MTNDVELLFTCLFALFTFIGEMSLQIFCPLFNQVICLSTEWEEFFMYFLDPSPLLDIGFAIFSPPFLFVSRFF